MFNLKRKLAVAMSGVLTLAMLAPAVAVPNVAKAAEEATAKQIAGVKFAANAAEISFGEKGTYYLDTVKGDKVKDTTVYKKVKEIDLSFLNGKAADLVLYQNDRDAERIEIEVEAQNKKVKASYNAGEQKLEVKDNGTVMGNGYNVRIGADEYFGDDEVKDIDFSKYYKKGATGYVWIPGNGKFDSNPASSPAVTITPASKEAKFKIPAQKKGPSVKIDVETVSFKVGKGCEWGLYDGETFVASGTAIDNKATTVNLVEAASQGGVKLTEKSLTLEVIKSATAKAPESKATVVKVPTMAGIDAVDTTTESGIEMEATYKKADSEQSGIQITNHSKDVTYQIALVADTSKISLTPENKADKIKWTKIAPGKAKKFAAAKCKDKYLIARVAGSKATKKAAMVLPSEIKANENKITIADKIANDVTLEVSKDDKVTGETGSGAAVKATAKDGGTLIAVVADKEVKAVSLKLKESDVKGTSLTSGEATKMAVAANKFIVVYEFKGGECTHFACKKVTSDMLY